MNGDEATRYLERQRQTASNVVSAVPQRRALKDGEWACLDAKCAYINSDRSRVCERCGKAKPRSKNRVGREIGKDAAEKSKGLFAAEDWACTKCGNVNWARRTTCNICNAPKLGDLEVRTGYGGGYMDRQNVEYIEREDDEEFDEFGRKKKRRKVDEDTKPKDERNGNENNEAEGNGQEDEEEEEEEGELSRKGVVDEEDEEEDGDDADLDKYDLSADEFEVEDLKAKIAARRAALANAVASPSRPDSRCSSDCSCSCSGGECSCEESESEEERRKSRIKEKEREKDKSEKDRDGDRDRKDRDRGRDRDRDRDRHERDHSRDRSPRHYSSSHRIKDRR